MSQLYVTEFTLMEFRSFADLRVELPAEPGVMIVHGTNGLGKSSLFDGLEWALTGKIDHFRDSTKGVSPKDYLRRWHAPNDRPTQVSLAFSDAEKVTRTLPSGLAKLSGFDSVTAYLRSPLWKQEIGDLQRYLLLTHFLGQSTLSRMTHRKPDERWQFLQEPAQSDWANKVAAGLHGHGNSAVAKVYERKSNELVREVAEMEQLLELEDHQWRESRAEGAIDEATGLAEATRLFSELAGMSPRVGTPQPAPETMAADSMIETVQKLEDRLADLSRTRESNLQRSRALLTNQQRVQQNVAACAAALTAAVAQIDSGEDELRSLLQKVVDQKAVLADVEALQAFGGVILRQLVSVQGFRIQSGEARKTLSDAHELVARLAADVEQATAKVRREEKRRALVARLDAEIADITKLSERCATRLRRVDDLENAESARVDASSTLDAAISANPDLEARLEAAEAEAQYSVDAAAALSAEFDAFRQSVDALSAAVSAVATNLPENQCDCPVCATHFDSAEDLRIRAAQAADRLAPTLGAHEKRMVDARVLRDRHNLARDLLRDAHAEIVARGQALNAAIAARDESSRELFGDVPFSESGMSRMRTDLNSELAELTRRRGRKEYWQQHPILGGRAGSLASWSLAIQQRNDIETEQLSQSRRVDELSKIQTSTEQRLTLAENEALKGVPTSDESLAGLIKARRDTQTDLEVRLEQTREKHRLASEAYELAIRAKAERMARRDELQRQATALATEHAEIIKEWQSLRISSGPLSADEVQRSERALAEVAVQRSLVEQRLGRLREGRAIWTRQVSHGRTVERLREFAGAAPNVGREALRTQLAAIQTEHLRKAEAIMRAKSIAQTSYGEVTQAVEAFNRAYLMPLNKLMNKLNRAILSEPDIGLDLRVDKKTVQQKAIKSPDAPSHVSKLDPQLVHSEGQMAALAVSMLCAANLTFPWSRWPGLILDDPLQHNDVIHAAAFADMLCNLIRAKGYQVFLSTHDLAQAEFLRRKFSAASVPCTTVHLLGRGPSGIDTSITYHGGRLVPSVTALTEGAQLG